jgi:hypothetical protein
MWNKIKYFLKNLFINKPHNFYCHCNKCTKKANYIRIYTYPNGAKAIFYNETLLRIKYNTGDEIYCEFVGGTYIVNSIKCHDGFVLKIN